jgi:hypothetical protein
MTCLERASLMMDVILSRLIPYSASLLRGLQYVTRQEEIGKHPHSLGTVPSEYSAPDVLSVIPTRYCGISDCQGGAERGRDILCLRILQCLGQECNCLFLVQMWFIFKY